MFRWKRATAALAVLGGVVLVASSCVVNGSWTQVAVSAPSRDPFTPAAFTEVSCPTTSFCAAVGSGTGAVWATWSGGAWSVTEGPTTDSEHHHVSCVSATECLVSREQFSSETGGLVGAVDLWDGSTLKPVLDTPSEPLISCTTGGFCLVADYGTAWTWDGSSFTIHQIEPWGFQRLSCVSSSFCMAIGASNAAEESGSEVRIWNGSDLTPISVPDSQPGAPIGYRDVSCFSATFCEVVGSTHSQPFEFAPAVAARWDGTSLTAEALPPSATHIMSSVSCSSRFSCVATHDFFFTPQPPSAYATNGINWYETPRPPAPSPTFDRYMDIDCVPNTNWCMAVGSGRSDNTNSYIAASYHWDNP